VESSHTNRTSTGINNTYTMKTNISAVSIVWSRGFPNLKIYILQTVSGNRISKVPGAFDEVMVNHATERKTNEQSEYI